MALSDYVTPVSRMCMLSRRGPKTSTGAHKLQRGFTGAAVSASSFRKRHRPHKWYVAGRADWCWTRLALFWCLQHHEDRLGPPCSNSQAIQPGEFHLQFRPFYLSSHTNFLPRNRAVLTLIFLTSLHNQLARQRAALDIVEVGQLHPVSHSHIPGLLLTSLSWFCWISAIPF